MIVKTLDNLTLEELQETYLCNKYGKDPLKCIDCEKHESCPAGKRAIEILEVTTKKHSRGEKGALAQHLKARQRAAELSKCDDPIKHLVEVEGLKYNAARERMRKYKNRYPDLFEEKKQVNLHLKYRKEDERKSDYLEAIKWDKPARYYVQKYGISYDTAWHRFKDDEKRYKKEKEDMVNDEDEVSLADFLKENATTVAASEPIEPGKEVKNEEYKNQDLVDQLKTKSEDLLLKREKIKDEIRALEDKLEWYDIALRSFDTIMNLLENEV